MGNNWVFVSVRRSTLLPLWKNRRHLLWAQHAAVCAGALGGVVVWWGINQSTCFTSPLKTQSSFSPAVCPVSLPLLPSTVTVPLLSRCPISAAKSHQGRLGLLGKVLSGADSRGGRREERCAGVMRGRRVNWRKRDHPVATEDSTQTLGARRFYAASIGEDGELEFGGGVWWWWWVMGNVWISMYFLRNFLQQDADTLFLSHFYSTLPAQTPKLNWYCRRDKSARLQLCLPAELPSWKKYARREPKTMRHF